MPIIILSYFAAVCLGLLAIAPPLEYSIPVMVNSFGWVYTVIVSALMGMFLLSKRLPLTFKMLVVYLWLSCFISFAPYLSFNAYILIIASLYFFLIFKHCDFKIILNMVEAVFWIQVFFGCMQMLGLDTLMNFDRPQPVFLGTVMQYMRFASHLAMLAPLLIVKNKWYIIPLIIIAIISHSSAFGFALIGGLFIYLILTYRRYLKIIIPLAILSCLGYFILDRSSFDIAFTCGRIPVWNDVIRTWVMDTSKVWINKDGGQYWLMPLSWPIDWKSIFFGRGIDTFLPLFPIFKHDLNPFPQAHSAPLQWLWEIGLIGFGFIVAYCINLIRRLYKSMQYCLIAGATIIIVNMCFAFPDRLTQNVLLIICFIAYCEHVLFCWKEAHLGFK